MYLLDTVAASDLLNSESAWHEPARLFFDGCQAKNAKVYASVVTLSEMRFGMELLPLRTPVLPHAAIDGIKTRIAWLEKSSLLDITKHVAHEHAALRAAYANAIAPNLLQKAKLKSKPPEMWIDKLPASKLLITENDLWLAATAIAHDLRLVTRDGDYKQLSIHLPRLKLQKLGPLA
ncbi:PIN domain-containing protein [Achromobacter sp. MY14]|uniref:type II toxin-antitoxin system VapC family toxin n=1 Tax=unclassified Achromobacter TaxID=2626865 RepID=UPI001E659118|nr:PIN domain-containing protein [Achromobacter sp. MY14]MCD0495548.1 PIN domain-containing protein [Achromobacter sp. MY14]